MPFFRIEMKNELQPNRHTFWRIFPCEKALCWLCDTEKKTVKNTLIIHFCSSLLEQIVVSQLLPQKYWYCMRLQILLSDSQAARRQMFHFPHFRDGSPTCFPFLCEYFHFEGSGPLISASIKWLSDAIIAQSRTLDSKTADEFFLKKGGRGEFFLRHNWKQLLGLQRISPPRRLPQDSISSLDVFSES